MNTAKVCGGEYRHELLHGQDFVTPSETQWQQICFVGVLEGMPISQRDWIQNWLHESAESEVAQLGVTKIRERWCLVPLLEHCGLRCALSATPDTTSYAGTGLTTA